MKASDLREKTVAELRQLETSLGRELWKARFDNYTNQLDSSAKIRNLRRDVARIKTLLTEKSKKDEAR